MRVVLVAMLVALSLGSGSAQTPDAGQTADNVQPMAKLRQMLDERLRVALGGLSLTADRIVLAQGGARAEGNVTITLNGAVITADDAFLQNGEVQLGNNARVKVSPK